MSILSETTMTTLDQIETKISDSYSQDEYYEDVYLMGACRGMDCSSTCFTNCTYDCEDECNHNCNDNCYGSCDLTE